MQSVQKLRKATHYSNLFFPVKSVALDITLLLCLCRGLLLCNDYI